MNLPPFLHDPLVLFLLGTFGLLARDVVKALLRAHAKKLREDKDPGNDPQAAAEDAMADALDRVRLPGGPR